MTDPGYVIVIEGPGTDGVERPLAREAVEIGRDDSADIRIDHPKVSRRHLRIEVRDGSVVLSDLASSHGVEINGQRIDAPSRVQATDDIRFAAHRLQVREATASAAFDVRVFLVGQTPPVESRTFAVSPGRASLGRDDDCDVTVEDHSVSRRHADIDFSGSEARLRVEDRASANGLWVNDARVRRADLRDLDRLRLGSVEFEVRVPLAVSLPVERLLESHEERSPRRPVVLGTVAVAIGVLAFAGALGSKLRLDGDPEQSPRPEPSSSLAPPSPAPAPEFPAVGQVDEPAPTRPPPIPRTRRRRSRARTAAPVPDPVAQSFNDRYDEDPAVPALVAYRRGDLAEAQRLATELDSPLARELRLSSTLDEIPRMQARVRTEVSNDPVRAAALLDVLAQLEAPLSPDGSPSFIVRELGVAVVDALSNQGAQRFDEGRYESAFQSWKTAVEIDPSHDQAADGIARLRIRARRLADDAEIAAQRGERAACNLWREVRDTTVPRSGLHERSLTRLEQYCRTGSGVP